MKLEHDPGVGVQTPPRKSYNPFDSDDDDTNGYTRNNVNYDIKSFEKSAESLTFHLETADLSWEEAIIAHSQIADHKIAPDVNGEEVLYRKDTELFTDKTVTECELPELMVCCKDSAYNSVKDIGIDEGVPTHDKVWVKTQDNQETKNDPGFLDDLTRGNGHHIEGLKSRSDYHFEKDDSVKVWTGDSVEDSGILDSESLKRQQPASECGPDDSKVVDEIKHDLSEKETNHCAKMTVDEMKLGDIVFDANIQLRENGEINKVEKKGIEAAAEYEQDSSTKPSVISNTGTTVASNENQDEEATTSVSPELTSSKESADTGVSGSLPYNSTVESGSIILDFDSSSTITGKQETEEEDEEESQPNEAVAVAKPPETQTMSRQEDVNHNSSIPASSMMMDRRVHGETSFSAAMPTPASITYTGPHAHNGSMSLRSESSHGSTRSFAFPVLQAEWNSSPVRMAKAEQRHMRKQRGWVHAIMCCRF